LHDALPIYFFGTANGTPEGVTYAPGVVGQAFNFDGGNSVYLPSMNVGLNFSVAFWIYPTRTSPVEQEVISYNPYGGQFRQLWFKGDAMLYNADQSVGSPPGSVPILGWSHVVLVQAEDGTRLYGNGSLAGASGRNSLP